jgi:hypothetical protein
MTQKPRYHQTYRDIVLPELASCGEGGGEEIVFRRR